MRRQESEDHAKGKKALSAVRGQERARDGRTEGTEAKEVSSTHRHPARRPAVPPSQGGAYTRISRYGQLICALLLSAPTFMTSLSRAMEAPPSWLAAQFLALQAPGAVPRLEPQRLRPGGRAADRPQQDRFSLRVPFCLGALSCAWLALPSHRVSLTYVYSFLLQCCCKMYVVKIYPEDSAAPHKLNSNAR